MSIAPDDRGFTLGHGLFETILSEGGVPRDWDAHLARLARGCGVLGLPAPDPADAGRAARAAAGTMARAAVRLTWSAGPGDRGLDQPAEPRPRLTVTAAPAPAPSGPASLITAKVRRNDQSPASRLKTLSYLDNVLARAEARAGGADEALMLNTRGEIACAAAANVFWIRDDVLFTPDLDCGVLDGIERARVLRAAVALGLVIGMVRATPDDLKGAAVFLTNSLIGVRPVSRLDGADLPSSPLVARLA
jgi:branched-chain amino acid aminotransferase/4-amino-4-deoxychorismate lyase